MDSKYCLSEEKYVLVVDRSVLLTKKGDIVVFNELGTIVYSAIRYFVTNDISVVPDSILDYCGKKYQSTN